MYPVHLRPSRYNPIWAGIRHRNVEDEIRPRVSVLEVACEAPYPLILFGHVVEAGGTALIHMVMDIVEEVRLSAWQEDGPPHAAGLVRCADRRQRYGAWPPFMRRPKQAKSCSGGRRRRLRAAPSAADRRRRCHGGGGELWRAWCCRRALEMPLRARCSLAAPWPCGRAGVQKRKSGECREARLNCAHLRLCNRPSRCCSGAASGRGAGSARGGAGRSSLQCRMALDACF